MNAAHHMLTFACATPGSNRETWFALINLYLCFNREIFTKFYCFRISGQACDGNEQLIIHGWARNAPSMTLPEGISTWSNNRLLNQVFSLLDVGFPVGRNTPYKYIVINIHYISAIKNDKSGNQLMISRKPYVYTTI